MGKANKETPEEINDTDISYARKVKTAMKLCNKYTPWQTACYVQAVTAKILLDQKHIPATVYIGFKKDNNATYKGHAWLRSGKLIVTGNINLSSFQVHSFYSS